MIVTPESRRPRTTSHMSRLSSTSTPADGSSRNRMLGSWLSALAIITRRFMPPDSVLILASFLSHSDRSRSTFSICAGFLPLAEQAAAERHRRPHRLEGVGGQFLRHQPDQRARRAELRDDVMAGRRHRAGARIDDAADDVDQRRLAGAVGPEQREDLALADLEIDVLQRLEAGLVDLRQMGDGDDRLHGDDDAERRRAGGTIRPARKEDPVYMSPTCLFKPWRPLASVPTPPDRPPHRPC